MSLALDEHEVADSELPTYDYTTSRPTQTSRYYTQPHTDHVFHLPKNKKHSLSLVLKSRAAAAQDPPKFIQNSDIVGSLNLDLNTEAVVRSVTVSVIGELFSRTDVTRFLSITQQLYVSDVNEVLPSSISPPVVGCGKLKGKHNWPFSIRLPKGVGIILSDERNNYRLPPSFLDARNKARVQYSIVARVKKGALSSGQRLSIPFDYTPQTRPSQPSIARQISYLDHTPLIGPEGDPEGWKSLPGVSVQGIVFSTHFVEAVCALSIARPLCYTRGSIIPLALKVSASDPQALGLLSAPSAPQVCLVRKALFAPSISVSAIRVIGPWDTEAEIVGTAIWWSVQGSGGISTDGDRYLQGEIRVPEGLIPNCRILNFSLEYEVAFEALRAIAFSPSTSSQSPLLLEKIDIATVSPESPLLMTHLPPDYTVNPT